MQETLVSFRVAELAKKKGFNVPTWDYFRVWFNDKQEVCNTQRKNYNSFFDTTDPKEEFFSRPAQDLLQKWLREIHNLHLYIDTTPSFEQMESHKSKYKATIKVPFKPFNWTTGYYYLGNTYEEAREEALFQALNLLPDANI